MSKDFLPPGFMAMLRASQKPDDQTDEALLQSARDGRLSEISNHFYNHRKCDHQAGDQAILVTELIGNPSAILRKEDLVKTIFDSGFMAEEIFEALDDGTTPFEKDMWNLYAADPGEDAARAGGKLMAEYIRYCIINNDKYEMPLKQLFSTAASAIDESRRMSESVVAIQNALVDYVAIEGPTLPLNKGASMLNVFNDAEGAEWWTKKLVEIKRKESYSTTKGDIVSYEPVFQ